MRYVECLPSPAFGVDVAPGDMTPMSGSSFRPEDKLSCVVVSSSTLSSSSLSPSFMPPLMTEPSRRSVVKVERRSRERGETLELRLPASSLPRTEGHAVETEVLVYQLIRKLGLPAPSVLRLTRSRSSKKVISASIRRPEGLHLSSMPWAATDPRRRQVQLQIDCAAEALAEQRCQLFGPVALVAGGKGSRSWSLAFAIMFETLLEDCEDEYVNIPYREIRQLLTRSRPLLDHVTEAGLVMPGFGEETNVLVDRETGRVSSYFGCREAYWGDAELYSRSTQIPVYRCYQAVRAIAINRFRPSAIVDADVITARSAMTTALGDHHFKLP